MHFDRYDICEAYNLLAHDYGLHDVHIRLHRIGFKVGHGRDTYEGLEENGQAIYDHRAQILDSLEV